LGYGYSGVITNILDDPEDRTFRMLLEFTIYDHKDGNWASHKPIGWAGTGSFAVILNEPANVASGYDSLAEGDYTVASGNCSHAEGSITTASGYASHAEGYDTVASGNRSHAEGSNTIAAGYAQHVQGTYNVEDSDYQYLHIVGNGNDNVRSNAHTLDWNGNAWFAGTVKIGADNKELATKEYVETLLGVIENGSY
jgi:hypothetical protein